MASVDKKRKIDSENRIFKSSWTESYFVVQQADVILCLICQETIAVHKENNIKKHYCSKHSSKFDGVVGQTRTDRINSMKQEIVAQQLLFKIGNQSAEGVYVG
ncbi:hypothetical protein HELRODRAFT_182329 [Helobdella robusta]|uniref:SPIN-DOC-like zinc-finger domain-containing protein n=1 Tax=Helobdella robusta TaxID=6412 RepID=T1FI27_HELRO|nr:hypothetical protein HELRODRAFT_182329 [Helobdella robusta]ESN91076.1 hypothetical protein HELRODRAFT_182329 [Helobdella robusta]